MHSNVFGKTNWLNINILKNTLNEIDNYDLLLVDSGGARVGIYDNIELFKKNIPIIFDDTMNSEYLKCADMVSKKLNKKITTIQCARNKYCNTWWDGKKYSIIN